MLEDLLPARAVAVEAYDDPPDAALLPAEEAVIARAVERRRREFTTVRACARAALVRLGEPPAAIVPGPGGAPRWPAGVVGSLTHCAGYRAAAVARAADVACLGIDAEPHEPLPDDLAGGDDRAVSLIMSPDERQRLLALAAGCPGVHWDRLLFCAKEAVYKAWYPVTGRWLDFTEADVTIDPGGGFVARLLVPGPVVDGRPVVAFPGRWSVGRGLALAAVTLPRRAGAPDARGDDPRGADAQVMRNE